MRNPKTTRDRAEDFCKRNHIDMGWVERVEQLLNRLLSDCTDIATARLVSGTSQYGSSMYDDGYAKACKDVKEDMEKFRK